MRCLLILSAAFCCAPLFAQQPPAQPAPLRTVAEESKFATTGTSAEVSAFVAELAKRTPLAKATTFGTTGKGSPLPLLILSDPPIATPQQAIEAKKPVALVFANIHAGEVDGKEAVLALARDLTATKDNAILKNLVVLIAPNFNPDGNDAISDKNRTSQNGPKAVGLRANADGFDLNRDFTKAETNEVRALLKLITAWNPAMIVDCHTTNGSYHRYTLTYDGPRHPAAHPDLIAYSRTKLLPGVSEEVKKATGFDSFSYGDFDREHKTWGTYPCQPRYGIQSFALRGTLGILSESYTYSSFEDRVKVSYAFVKANLEHFAANRDAVVKLAADAAKPRERVALRVKTVAQEKPVAVKGWVEENGKKTDTPKDYECAIVDRVEATAEATVPAAYLIPAEYAAAADTLRRHGIQVEELREQCEVKGERYTVTEIGRAGKTYQGHTHTKLEVKPEAVTIQAQPGAFLVSTRQTLGTFAAYLLEPLAEDGLAAWNAFDAGLKVGQPFPVLRLTGDQPLFTGPPKPLPEDRVTGKKFTEADLVGRSGLGGQPLGEITWLEDGEHWLQAKAGKLWKVHARSGRAELFVDPAKLTASLAALTDLDKKQLPQWVNGPRYTFDPARTGVLVNTGVGLVFAKRDGSPAVRLTKDKGSEFPEFSPDGERLAFVRDGNLHTVALKDGAAKQLTTDGGKNDILNARADWVYEEEIFNRNGRAFWWSPDGKQLAFLRFDDKKVPKFHLTHSPGPRGSLETIPYPKPGDANPLVSLGVVPADGTASPTFLSMNGYKPDDTLVARVGWVPGKMPVPFAYVQDRRQTKLDFVTWPAADKPKVLFTDKTAAWIDDLGEPKFLKDGSFLFLSERSGWKHLYRYAADGQLIGPVTDGKWEVQKVERIDEASGDVYFTSGKVRSTGSHLCLATLGQPGVQVISPEEPTHAISMAPTGTLYVDRSGDDHTPAVAVLRELYTKVVRVLDTNPVHARGEYRFGRYERTTIKTPDGFEMEAAVTYPPDFHELNRYPVWILTYAGPHAPTVRDGWGNGRVTEQIMAAMGVIVLRVDPRSASGKGAESAWKCYKQLGVQELADLEAAADWIGKQPWADKTRIGLSGHSFGGYITAYALTHSKKFAAGVAGAPVTDWRLYDTIYTERFMGLPAENKANYDKTSVITAAKDLHGKLLIVHGMIDDNVHAQNSLQLIEALQKADKEFEVMVYPSSRHPIFTTHYPKTQLRFIRKAFGLTE